MQESWINNQDDFNELVSYLNDNKLSFNLLHFDLTEDCNVIQVEDMKIHVPSLYQWPRKKHDPLIFGKDSTENITNITVQNETVYIHKSNGKTETRPYLNWALGANWTDGAQKLSGNQYYKYIKDLPEEKFQDLKQNWNPSIWTPRTAPEGFMLRSGMTYYKGMKVNDVSLLSFDIEATTLDKDHPDAQVALLSTTSRDRKGNITKHLFDIFDYADYGSFFSSICAYVRKQNPDIILGHNILGYDLPYLCNAGDINWGKNLSSIKFDDTISKFRKDGSQQYEYHNAHVFGREIIDTFFLSIKYDIGREFPSYGLKAIEKHLGLVKEDRSWDFQKWPVKKLMEERKKGNTEIWNKFRQYCQDDSDSPIKMFDIMIPSLFYLCQSVPKTLQQMINEASGSQLDSLMVRAYLQDGCSLPRSSRKEEFEGAISMGVPGVYKNVRKVDVASLYPSIMLEHNIYDRQKDPSRYMLKMLEYFRDQRLENKRLAKETGDKHYDDLQNAQKIMINSMYGFLGANYLLFNYPKGAAEVTRYGREILLQGVEWATGHTLEKVVKSVSNEGEENEQEKFHWIVGKNVAEHLSFKSNTYKLVNVDTDSFSYTNDIAPTKEEFDAEIVTLNSLYPKLISWEKDGKKGVFDDIIVVKAKNYVIREGDKVKFKGSSLTDQKKEPILIDLLEKCINTIMYTKGQDLKLLYDSACRQAMNPVDIKPWCVKKTITNAVFNSERLNETKVLDACNRAIKAGVVSGIQEGDKIYLYQAIDGEVQAMAKGQPVFSKKGEPKMIENCVLKFPELFNKDHDKWHYVERVYATISILSNIVDMNLFTKYHLKKNRELL